MVLESTQMLSTAMNLASEGVAKGRDNPGPYKSSHAFHPVSVWVRSTQTNYQWLLDHYIALCEEYRQRFNKTHKCAQYVKQLKWGKSLIPVGGLTEFINCTSFKEERNVYLAYRKYLMYKWKNDKRKPKWTNVRKPSFYL